MNSIICINCTNKNGEEFDRFKKKQWENCVFPALEKFEEMVRGNSFFLDYLTIIDFSIYELIRYM